MCLRKRLAAVAEIVVVRRARADDRHLGASARAAGRRASLIAAFLALVARPAASAPRCSRRVRLRPRRAALRDVGRLEGRGADPARRVRGRGSTSTTRSGSTRRCSSSCWRRWSCRAGRSRSPPRRLGVESPYATRRTVCVRPVARTSSSASTTRTQPASRTTARRRRTRSGRGGARARCGSARRRAGCGGRRGTSPSRHARPRAGRSLQL